MTGDPSSVSRMKGSLRIYISEYGSTTARHLLNIAVGGDGGVMVIPNNHTRTGWDIRLEERAIFRSSSDVKESWPASVSPRLHYHRSGLTNIEPQKLEHVRKPAIDLPHLATVTGKQIFSLNVTRPEAIPAVSLRDAFGSGKKPRMVNYLHNGFPHTISVAGVVYPNKVAPWWKWEAVSADNPFLSIRTPAMTEHCYSLVGHGLDSFLVLRFQQVLPEDAPLVGMDIQEGPSISLSGLCGLYEWPSPSIHVTTRGLAPRNWILDRESLPRFVKMRRNDRSWARALIHRDLTDGAIVHREKF